MIVEFYTKGGTEKVALITTDYVPLIGDVVWLGEPDPYRYVVKYRDFSLRRAELVATVVLE